MILPPFTLLCVVVTLLSRSAKLLASTILVDCETDEIPPSVSYCAYPTTGLCTIRSAWQTCFQELEPCEIVLPPNTFINVNSSFGSFMLSSGMDVTIQGQGSTLQPILQQMQFITSNADPSGNAPYLRIEMLTIENFGAIANDGAALSISGNATLILEQVVFQNLTAHSGGAIYMANNTLPTRISNSSFFNCMADAGGGAIAVHRTSAVLIANSFFKNCSAHETATGAGGSIQITEGRDILITDSVFSNSHANASGGAIYLAHNSVNATIKRSEFEHCSAAVSGGGVYVYKNNKNILIVDSSFARCGAGHYSGAIGFEKNHGSAVLENVTVHDCHAASAGGGAGINSHTGSFLLAGSTFTSCSAQRGGTLAAAAISEKFTVVDTTIKDSTSQFGGCAYLQNCEDVILMRGILFNCSAANEGGGIFGDTISSLTINDTSVSQCSARTNSGGGIFLQKTSLSLIGSTIQNCKSYNRGGALRITNSGESSSIENSVIRNSTAAGGGGGIYVDTIRSLVINDTVVSNCNALNSSGGGMYLQQTVLSLTGTTIVDCKGELGGALYLSNSGDACLIERCVLRDNTAANEGGGIFGDTISSLAINQTIINHCHARIGSGGGIFLQKTSLSLIGSTIKNCESSSRGGALRLTNSKDTSLIENCVIRSNTAAYGGGGIDGDDILSLTMINTIISNCNGRADRGGGMFLGETTLFMTFNTVENCKSEIGGGISLYNSGKNSFIKNCAIRNNSATSTGEGGGGLLVKTAQDFLILNSTFEHNSASNGNGGGLYVSAIDGFTIVNTIIQSNAAYYSGGGVYAGAKNMRFLFGGLHAMGNHALLSDGGGLYLSSNVPNLAIVDGAAAANAVTVQTAHPYSHIFRTTFFDEKYTTSLGFVITFDPRCKIGYDDLLYITAGKLKYTFGANSLYPGVEAAPLFVYATEVRLQFVSGLLPVSPTEKLYGVKLYLTPLVSSSTQPCEFGSNSAGGNGGGMYASQGLVSSLLLNSIFANNTVATNGGGLYLGLSIQYLTVRNVSITNNTAKSNGGGIYMDNNLVSNSFSHVYIARNRAKLLNGGGLFIALNAEGTFNDSVFEDNTAANGGGIAMQTTLDGWLFERVVFTRNKAVKTLVSGAKINGGAVALLFDNGKNSPIRFQSCSFAENHALHGGAIYADTGNMAIFTGSMFTSNNASDGGGIFLASGNQFTVINSSFALNTAAVGGGAIVALDGSSVNIGGSVLELNTATIGGALFLKNTVDGNFENTTFRHNVAREVGGAIASIGSPLWTSGNSVLSFEHNRAMRGSAVYFQALINDASNSIHNTMFIDNVGLVGGTVYWVYDSKSMKSEPAGLNSSSNFWFNNTAPYGSRAATQAVHLLGPVVYNLRVFVQSTLSKPMVFTLQDFYNQYIPLTGSSSVEPTTFNNFDHSCFPGHPAVVGTDTQGVVFTKGNATFKHLSPLCYPGKSMTITFTAQLGSEFARFESTSTSVVQSYFVETSTQVNFRACEMGEIIQDEVCVSCPEDTYSLKSKVTEETKCNSCNNMQGVDTCIGNLLTLKKGYWRRYNTSAAVQVCPVALNGCKGGDMTGFNLCEEGFSGPLCAVCAKNYFQDGDDCLKCNGPHRLPFGAIMFILAAGVVLLLFSAYAYRRYHQLQNQPLQNVRLKNLSSRIYNVLDQILLWWAARYRILIVKGKILIATYQIVTAVPTVLSVMVPKSFTSFLNGLDFVNFSFVSLLSLQCSVKYNFMDKLIVATLLPIGIVALLFVAFLTHASYIAKEIKKNPHRKVGEGRALFNALKDQYLNYFFYLTYLILPSITTRIFKMFLCTNIDPKNEDNDENDWYLTADMNISCSSAYYHRGVAYAIFMIFVYPVGITSMYAYLLYTHRIEIQQRQCKSEEVEELLEPEADTEINTDSFTNFAEELEAGRVSEIQHTDNPMFLSSPLSRSTTASESTPTHPVYSKRPSRKNSIGRERTTSTATFIAGVSTVGRKNRFGMSAPAARLAFLWGAYHPVYWYWELIETSRRLMLTAVLSATGAGTSKQAVLALLLALIYIKLYGYFSPYEQAPSNVTAEVGQYQILVTFIGALILMESLLGRGYNPTVGALLVFFNLGVLFAFSYYEMRDLLEEQASVREAEASGDKGENDNELRAGAKETKLNGPRDVVEIEMTDVALSK